MAVKILTETNSETTIGGYERFVREARLASSLRHPNIVSPVDFGEDRHHGIVYFAMEYIEGVDLHELLDESRVTLPLALEILYQTCGALTDAHDKGIIHRDLKPGNVRLTVISDGALQAKVLDLGLARPIDSHSDITQSGNIAGTVSYIPPEYILDGTLGGYSDLYSLGIVFFELLTGQKPFCGNHLQVLCHHVSSSPPSIADYIPDADGLDVALVDDVEHLFRRLVAKKPRYRFESAHKVRASIEDLRQSYGIESPSVTSPSESATVDTFRPWLAPAASPEEDIQPLPSEAVEKLVQVGAEMVTADSEDGKAKVQFPTPPPLPAHIADDASCRHSDSNLLAPHHPFPDTSDSNTERRQTHPTPRRFVITSLAAVVAIAVVFVALFELRNRHSPPSAPSPSPTATVTESKDAWDDEPLQKSATDYTVEIPPRQKETSRPDRDLSSIDFRIGSNEGPSEDSTHDNAATKDDEASTSVHEAKPPSSRPAAEDPVDDVSDANDDEFEQLRDRAGSL